MSVKMKSKWVSNALVVLGGFLYAAGMNIFIVPFGLYSGGAVGIAQIITLLLRCSNLNGIIYMVLNLPLLWLAYKSMGRKFFIRTILGSGSISLFMSIVPVFKVVEDCLASVLIGGIITGFGVGIILLSGGCGGGIDIIGVWAARKYKNISVGKISLAVNGIIFAALLLLSDIQTVIYSVIYMVFSTIMLDKIHYQNINVRLMIFTKKEGIDKSILEKTGRGVTEWTGVGAYTHENTHVLVSCINKYEAAEFRDIIKKADPDAFMIMDEGVSVFGNFEKRI